MFGAVDDYAKTSTLTAQEKNPRSLTTKCKSDGVAFMRASLDPANVVISLLPALEETKNEPKLKISSEVVHVTSKVSSQVLLRRFDFSFTAVSWKMLYY